jgi:CubicO group peptidase (beta-lactamase class C family)
MRARACLLIAATTVAECGGSAHKDQSQPRTAPRAQRPAAFPTQPEGVRFPTRSWPRGAWPSGVDRAAVDQAADAAGRGSAMERPDRPPTRDHARRLSRMVASRDAAGYVAGKDLANKPGSEFQYNTGNTILVDRIIADEVGSGSAFRRFIRSRLLDRIGMSRLHMAFDGTGTWLGGVSADTTAQGFAKLGLLYLRDGVWDGERILPEGWVQ